MLQVKTFDESSYPELEIEINAWLTDKEEPKAIVSYSVSLEKPVAIYHWMHARDYALMQAQQSASKLIRPQ